MPILHSHLIKRLAVVFALIAIVLANALANIIPTGNQTTEKALDSFAIVFTTDFIFSIWGLIYFVLMTYVIYKTFQNRDLPPTIGWLFVLSWVFNVSWLFTWRYSLILGSLQIMIGLLLTLITIYLYLEIWVQKTNSPTKLILIIGNGFNFYLGYIIVATVANTSMVSYYINWSFWGINPAGWATILLGLTTLIGVATLVTQRDMVFVVVLMGAFIGITVKHWEIALIGYTALVATFIMFVLAFLLLKKKFMAASSLIALLFISACNSNQVIFTITIKNVSNSETLAKRKEVIISPGAIVLHKQNTKPIFTSGEKASAGLEKLAEEGNPDDLVKELEQNKNVTTVKVFAIPSGIKPGERQSIKTTARPGDSLSLAAMFMQSNDLFFATVDTGISLFDNNTARTTSTVDIKLWEAHTEVNQTLGNGNNQPPNIGGKDEDGVITIFADTNNEIKNKIIEVSIVAN